MILRLSLHDSQELLSQERKLKIHSPSRKQLQQQRCKNLNIVENNFHMENRFPIAVASFGGVQSVCGTLLSDIKGIAPNESTQ
jgi:hypothetical protein